MGSLKESEAEMDPVRDTEEGPARLESTSGSAAAEKWHAEIEAAPARHLAENKQPGYAVRRFPGDRNGDPRVLGRSGGLASAARGHFIEEVFITVPLERGLVVSSALEPNAAKLQQLGCKPCHSDLQTIVKSTWHRQIAHALAQRDGQRRTVAGGTL